MQTSIVVTLYILLKVPGYSLHYTVQITSSYKGLKMQYISGVPVFGNYSTKNSFTCVDYKVLGTTGCKEDHFMVAFAHARHMRVPFKL